MGANRSQKNVKAVAEDMLHGAAQYRDIDPSDVEEWAMDLLESVGLPQTLVGSEAYDDDRAEAWRLWRDGYRPAKAKTLRPNMMVASKETDVFRIQNVGMINYVRVVEVKRNLEYAGSVSAWHTGSGGRDEPAIMDPEAEVWVKRRA